MDLEPKSETVDAPDEVGWYTVSASTLWIGLM